MPTNDERREVAENLRTMTMCGCRYAEEFYELLSETVMNVGDFHSFNDVADRLADLIEPQERTCRFMPENIHWYFDENDNEIVTEEGHPDGSEACNCSQCGYPMMAGEGGWFNESKGPHGGIIYEPRFSFCPNCGTRVTS